MKIFLFLLLIPITSAFSGQRIAAIVGDHVITEYELEQKIRFIMFSQGISKEGNILDIAVDMNVIKKSGSWYEYDGSKIGQGRDSAKEYLVQNPKITIEVESKIKKLVLSGKEAVPLEIAVEDQDDDTLSDTEE
jgi:hypothetical protein